MFFLISYRVCFCLCDNESVANGNYSLCLESSDQRDVMLLSEEKKLYPSIVLTRGEVETSQALRRRVNYRIEVSGRPRRGDRRPGGDLKLAEVRKRPSALFSFRGFIAQSPFQRVSGNR